MELRRTTRRWQQERGASLVELTLALPLLLILLLGIVSYGMILSFKQGMTQLAAEAARAGAVAGPAEAVGTADALLGVDAPSVLSRDCGDKGLTCDVVLVDCTGGNPDCRIEVEVRFDNAGHPLAPPVPFLSAVFPSTMTARSVARVSGP